MKDETNNIETYNIETYRLTFDHFLTIDGKRVRLEQPLIVETVIDVHEPLAVCVNRIVEEMSRELTRRVLEGAQE